MKKKQIPPDFVLDEYEIARDLVIKFIEDDPGGADFSSLFKHAQESLSAQGFRKEQIKRYVQRILFNLREAGLVDTLPTSNSEQIRLAVERRETVLDATRRGYTTLVKRLLNRGFDSDTKDAALVSAVINNRVEITRLLIDSGANVNARERVFNRTPLMYVTNRTSKEIEALLRNAGADE